MIQWNGNWYGEPARNNFSVAPGAPGWVPGGPKSAFAYSWVPRFYPSPREYALTVSRRLISGTMDLAKDRKAISIALQRAATWGMTAVKTVDLDDWQGVLSQAAAEQARALSTNMFTLIPELLHLRSGVSSLLDQLKTTWKKHSVRSLADLELSLRYGVQLTLSDVVAQAQRLNQQRTTLQGDCRARSMSSIVGDSSVQGVPVPYRIDYHLKVWYDPTPNDPVHQAVWSLLSYKLLPTLEDSWDAVPYSFIIDWLLNLDNTLAQVDARTLISALQVDSALFSRRKSYSLSSRLVPDLRGLVQGMVSFVDYARFDTGGLVPPAPSFAGFTQFHNFVEAGAILIQKLRH